MKKSIMIFAFLICVNTFAQNDDFRTGRRGKLFFSVGTEYRITPLPTNDGVGKNPLASYTNSDRQNSGATIFYNLDYFVTKKLSLGFSHSFRYALLNYSDTFDIEGNFGQIKADYTLMMGYHFYLDYHFKVFKKAELFARVGISLINRNSQFTLKETFFDSQGNIFIIHGSRLFYDMQPKNYAIGYKKK